MTPPGQPGQWELQTVAPRELVGARSLAGTFLEKGVLRRMRVRGALLPRERDLQLASQCLVRLAEESPPLTA